MARITLHVHAINRLNHHNMSYLKHRYHRLNMHWALHSDVVGWISVSKQIKSHMKYVRIQNVIPDRYWHCAKYIHRPTNKFLKCSQPKKFWFSKASGLPVCLSNPPFGHSNKKKQSIISTIVKKKRCKMWYNHYDMFIATIQLEISNLMQQEIRHWANTNSPC